MGLMATFRADAELRSRALSKLGIIDQLVLYVGDIHVGQLSPGCMVLQGWVWLQRGVTQDTSFKEPRGPFPVCCCFLSTCVFLMKEVLTLATLQLLVFREGSCGNDSLITLCTDSSG